MDLREVRAQNAMQRRPHIKRRRARLLTLNPGFGQRRNVTLCLEGAGGQANRLRLEAESATDFDPDTGKERPNPNGVKRMRRQTWVMTYYRKGAINHQQAAVAERLRMAAEGMRERDPLAAIGEPKVRDSGGAMAARIDARRYFTAMWGMIPRRCRSVVERVVLDDDPIPHGNSAQRERYMKRLCEGLDAIA